MDSTPLNPPVTMLDELAAAASAAGSARTPRIGLLTFHYVPNYGAVLQAYVLSRLLGAEIVDHRYRRKQEHYVAQSAQHERLHAFIDGQLPLSQYQLAADDFENERTFQEINETYDGIVVGSDEIWKVRYQRQRMRRSLKDWLRRRPAKTQVYQSDATATPFPNIYWGDVRIPRFAFAASAGTTRFSHIPPEHRAVMAAMLERFERLGVRDQKTFELLLQLNPDLQDRIERVPDPVFALAPDWLPDGRQVLERLGITAPSVAFVHVSPAHRDMLEALALPDIPLLDLDALDLDPLEWAAVIGSCQFGITDRMHALICALVGNVPCLTVDPRPKTRELVESFGLPETTSLDELCRSWPAVASRVAERRKTVCDFAASIRDTIARSAQPPY